MSYIGRGLDKISNVETLDNITFDGSTTYALTKSSSAYTPVSASSLLVSIDGVIQAGNFSVSTTNIVFDWSPTSSNTNNFIRHYGVGVSLTPSDDSVTGAKIADDAIDSEHYVDGSIDAAHIASDAVTTAKILNDNVTAAKMADNSVDSDAYVDGSIDAVHLSANSVDSDAYVDGSIDAVHLSANSVDSDAYVDASIDNAHLADNAVDTAEIADNAVSLAKMAGLARGKIIVGDASGNPAALTVGSNTQVLKSDGTDISWGTDSGGAALTGSTNNQVTTVTGANAITGETNLIYDGTRLGVGAAGASADLAAGIHIKTSDSGGGTVNGDADDFLIEHSGSGGMSIYSGTSSEGSIKFGDSGGNDRGIIKYNHSSDSIRMWTNGAEAMVIDSTGAVTKPLQPAFHVRKSSWQSNIAVGSQVVIEMNSERFDNNGDWDTGTYTFTAPVTGKYAFFGYFRTLAMDKDCNAVTYRVNASNEAQQICSWRPWNYTIGSDFDYFDMNGHVLMDMDAADTATFEVYQEAGTAQMDFPSYYVHCQGWLVC